jgi:protein-S-isoprenylcysteine O-methyltransferase Ste14
MAAFWVAWTIPFLLNRARGQGKAVRIDPRARLGIMIVSAGYLVANTHAPAVWNVRIETWRAFSGVVFGLAAIALVWMAVGNLGRQWRVDAGLNADHELVQSGAYRLVRHPIYLSMFCMLLMNVAMVGTLPGWPVAIVLALVGTEIRVRVEDGLLQERFGATFTEWQKRVPAYLPFVR